MGNKRVTQPIKGIHRIWLQTRVPILGYLPKDGRKGPTQKSHQCPIKEHYSLEIFQIIHQIGGPIINLQLWHLKVPWQLLLYNVGSEGWVSTEAKTFTFTLSRTSQDFNALVQLLEPIVYLYISGGMPSDAEV